MTDLKVVGGTSKRRRYTKREKATAVVNATLSSTLAAAESMGVPESTIRYWLDDPRFAQLREKTREETAAGFGVLIHMAQARLEQLIPTMEARDLTILLGVATEKGQLLSGGATSRSETRELLADFDDHERDAMTEWLHKLARERLDVVTTPT